MLDAHGEVLGRAEALLGEHQDSDDGVMPRWEGRAVVGHPAWSGVLIGPVRWRTVVASRAPIAVRFDDGRLGQCLATYTGPADPNQVQVQGGPPVPFGERA